MSLFFDGNSKDRSKKTKHRPISKPQPVYRAGLEILEERTTPATSLSQTILGDLWQPAPLSAVSRTGPSVSYLRTTETAIFSLDTDRMAQSLDQAPLEIFDAATQPATEIVLADPSGNPQRFSIFESPVMAPELAAKYPEIKTYAGQGIDDPSATVRLDISPAGFHAQVLSPGGRWYIDPYFHLETQVYASYTGASATLIPEYHEHPELLADVDHDGHDHSAEVARDSDAPGLPAGSTANGQATVARSGTQLRTYRTAVAATGEYTAFHGGTVALGQAAIVTAINRVSGIYENELSIRLQLVPNNDLLVYTNSGSDPYTNNNPSALLGENQTNIDAVIGSANYDIGHVFSTGGGGLAGLGVVGINGVKAQGETGLGAPIGDVFYVDYVAHEMGHQFGGNHTFNGDSGACSGGNRNGPTAYEPGSGSTIQAYAGICGNDDLQPNSDAYFHSLSFDEIIDHVDNVIPAVGTRTNTGNAIPTVNAGSDFAIPARTPFTLTAIGNDADGNGSLTYNWEQRDLGPQQDVLAPDNGSSPLWRSFSPTTDPSRTFPRLSDLVNNTVSIGEKYALQARAMDFRVTVRDNRAAGGAVNTDDMVVNVIDTGAPFKVTSPNTAVTYPGFSTQTVTWDVAGTTANGINVSNVRILLSTDGGFTYPRVLAASVTNNGSANVTIPNVPTTTARIRVEAVGSIFFDISDQNFEITNAGQLIEGVKFEDVNANQVQDPGEPGLAGWTIYSDLNGNNRIDDAPPVNFSSTDVPKAVPDSGMTTSSLSVSGLVAYTTDINVTLTLNHPFDSDMTVNLVGPTGQRVTLFSGVGGAGDNFINTTLDDEAATTIASASAPFVGVFRPQQPLSAFDGLDPNGAWTLELIDGATGNVGSLTSWSIRITTPSEPVAVTAVDGSYLLVGNPVGSFAVREILQPGWEQTAPKGVSRLFAIPTDGTNQIVELHPSTGAELRRFAAPAATGGSTEGLAFSGTSLFFTSAASDRIFELNPNTGAVIDSDPITTANGNPESLAWLDGRLYVSDFGSSQISVFNPTTDAVERVINVNAVNPGVNLAGGLAGITNPNALLASTQSGRLAQIDPVTGEVVTEINLGTTPLGIGVAGDVIYFSGLSGGVDTFSRKGAYLGQFGGTTPYAAFGGDNTTDHGFVVTLNPGDNLTNIDLGNRRQRGGVRGSKWADLDQDGVRDFGEQGLQNWVIFLDENANQALDFNVVNVASAHAPIVIDGSVIHVSPINVVATGPVRDVHVTLDIRHTFDADLKVSLISPIGTRVLLFEGVGGAGDNFTGTGIGDRGGSPIRNGVAPFSTEFRPFQPMSRFDGDEAAGIWTLEIVDSSPTENGFLDGWALELITGERAVVTDANGDYQFANVPVGTYTVREVLQTGWVQTFPTAPGEHNLTVNAGEFSAALDFGNFKPNTPPTLASVGSFTLDEGQTLNFTAVATDPDLPGDTLTYSLVGAPPGASIDPLTGVFTWPTTELDGGTFYIFGIRVDDDGLIPESDEIMVTVTVNEINHPPVLDPIGNQTVTEGSTLVISPSATDADDPVNTLTYTLMNGPAGASIDPFTGVVTWFPLEAQGPNVYTVTLRVTDDGTPNLFDEEMFTITVLEGNFPPVLDPIGAKVVDEQTLLTFTATASDPDVPADTLRFSLVSAPVGASINPTTGVFQWTPSETQGPGVFNFTVRVSDLGTPNLIDDEIIQVTVNDVNRTPTLNAISNQNVDELTTLTVTATATDPDRPNNTLTFSLSVAPTGATIDPTTGQFSWTPGEADGPGVFNVTVRVTDNGPQILFDEKSFQITVNEVNALPSVNAISDQSINEGATLSLTVTATDPDMPANSFTYILDSAPTGVMLDSLTGALSWTPTEAQGPGTYQITVSVRDNGTPPLVSSTKTFNVTVNEVNVAPILAAIGNRTFDELALATFTATATDADVPGNTLTFSVSTAPTGASIDPITGVFTWTPTELQGPASYNITIRVTDNGASNLFDEETITITVAEVNVPPVLDPIGNRTVLEGGTLVFTATGSDADRPAQSLSFSLIGAPAGAGINATTGLFSWAPTEADGPGIYSFAVRVTDNSTPDLFDEETIQVTVTEVNQAPTITPVPSQSVAEGSLLTFTVSAVDNDTPVNTIAFSLVGAPAGASIDAMTGVFQWTPTENQGPGTYTFVVRATDNGSLPLSDDETLSITVSEVNTAPTLNAIGNRNAAEGVLLTFQATASDSDLPANGLAFTLVNGPVGATIDPATGVFRWTPNEAQGPGSSTFAVRVTDNGSTSLFTEEMITVTVAETNQAPVLSTIGDRFVDELAELRFTASATDADEPANGLTYSLLNPPAGATIDPTTGVFSWTPIEANGPGSFQITIRVSDDGAPILTDEETITVTVREVNNTPVLTAPGTFNIDEGAALDVTLLAVDPDLPANTLTYSLPNGGPAGMTIDPLTGRIQWGPTESQGPATYSILVRVTDTGSPSQFAEGQLTIVVREVNQSPILNTIGAKSVKEGGILTFRASASDPDVPENRFEFTLVSGPAGATLDSATGEFRWIPSETQGPGSFLATVRVSDGATTPLTAEETFQITVTEVNEEPTLAPIPRQSVREGQTLTFVATASDVDVPNNTLTFSLSSFPAGAQIDGTTGQFTWTPTEQQGPGSFVAVVRVTDNGSGNLFVERTVNIDVLEENEPPVLGPISDRTVTELNLLAFTVTATDSDAPANAIKFELRNPPVGASVNANTGAFAWTPTEEQGAGVYQITVRAFDPDNVSLFHERVFQVTVLEQNQAPIVPTISPKVVAEGVQLTFPIQANDPDFPAETLSFTIVTGPAGATLDATTGVFAWTPTETQGPANVPVRVRVTDNGSPNLSTETSFEIVVTESNEPPTLAPIGPLSANEGALFQFTASATDPDAPANTLTFTLINPPVGATIDPATGVFRFTPGEAVGPATLPFTVRVTDNGAGALFDEETVTLTINEVNRPPVLTGIGPKEIAEGSTLVFTAFASDPDLPANTLVFSLGVGAPAGANIDPTTGRFTWTPAEDQGPSVTPITVRVHDQGTPSLFAEEVISVTVREVNQAPTLAPIANQSVVEGTLLTFTAQGADADVPVNTLTYQLGAGAPVGAMIDPTTGVFRWTPTESQGPGSYSVTVIVIDNAPVAAQTQRNVSITVTEQNDAPILAAIGAQGVDEGKLLTFTASVTDADLPAGAFDFSLVNAPPGAVIDLRTGVFSWTPTEGDGPRVANVTVRVTDRNAPASFDEEVVAITVRELNAAPVFGALPIGLSTQPGQSFTFVVSATDADLPANTLSFSLVNGPSGSSINPTTGVVSWSVPANQLAGPVDFTVRVQDNGDPVGSAESTVRVEVVVPVRNELFQGFTDPLDQIAGGRISATNRNEQVTLINAGADASRVAVRVIDPIAGTKTLEFTGDPNFGLFTGPNDRTFVGDVDGDGVSELIQFNRPEAGAPLQGPAIRVLNLGSGAVIREFGYSQSIAGRTFADTLATLVDPGDDVFVGHFTQKLQLEALYFNRTTSAAGAVSLRVINLVSGQVVDTGVHNGQNFSGWVDPADEIIANDTDFDGLDDLIFVNRTADFNSNRATNLGFVGMVSLTNPTGRQGENIGFYRFFDWNYARTGEQSVFPGYDEPGDRVTFGKIVNGNRTSLVIVLVNSQFDGNPPAAAFALLEPAPIVQGVRDSFQLISTQFRRDLPASSFDTDDNFLMVDANGDGSDEFVSYSRASGGLSLRTFNSLNGALLGEITDTGAPGSGTNRATSVGPQSIPAPTPTATPPLVVAQTALGGPTVRLMANQVDEILADVGSESRRHLGYDAWGEEDSFEF